MTEAGSPNEHTTCTDFYERGPEAPFVVGARSAGTDPVHMFNIYKPAGEYPFPGTRDVTLVRVLGDSGMVDYEHGGFKRSPYRYAHGELEITPPWTSGNIVADASGRLMVLALPLEQLRNAVREAEPDFDGSFGELHASTFRSPLINILCSQLWQHSSSDNRYGRLFADGILLAMAAELLRLADKDLPNETQTGATLSSVVKNRLNEFIDAHSSEKLALADLAGLAAMPESTFLRAFKATTGQTPYQFVLDRRIARALDLLASPRHSLSDIAYACGFASQSHMTDVFRQKVGVTPGQYRRELKS